MSGTVHTTRDRRPQGPERSERTAAPTLSEPTLTVGHAHDPAEHQADRVAEQVMARLSAGREPLIEPAQPDAVLQRRPTPGPSGGVAGGAVSASLSGQIDQARGRGTQLPGTLRRAVERTTGSDLSGVRVHTDEAAARTVRAVGAVAYTLGSDIFFDRGQYRPGTPSGQELIAHEAAHAAQNSGGGRTIQRRLAGTARATEDLGGAESSGRGRRLIGKRKNWDNILRGLREYEQMEGRLSNAHVADFQKAKTPMLKKLRSVKSSVDEWKVANKDEEWDQRAANHHRIISEDDSRVATEDQRAKGARRQAIALLDPRLSVEEDLVRSPSPIPWLESLALNQSTLKGSGRADAGQKNQVQENTYGGGKQALFTGFFKQDKGFGVDQESHETRSGIRQHDPRYGARAVAMYKLDRLFNAGVTARAEFAIGTAGSKSVFGTVLESAKGKRTDEHSYAATNADAAGVGGGAISLEDPVLQRSLNKLQILDAIAGQLDRHGGNYYIEADKQGKVKSVTGIDLDMAFGADMMSHANSVNAHNYKGLPPVIDEEMGRAILATESKTLADALYGLLPPAEIRAAVSRFESVKAEVKKADDANQLRSSWGAQSALERPSYAKSKFAFNNSNYFHDIAVGARLGLIRRVEDTATRILDGRDSLFEMRADLARELREFPEDLRRGLALAFSENRVGVVDDVAEFLAENRIPNRDMPRFVEIAIDEWILPGKMDDFLLAAQEAHGLHDVKTLAKGLFDRPFREAGLQRAAARLAAG